MATNFKDFIKSGEEFFEQLSPELSLLFSGELICQPDHLCYRVSSKDEYKAFVEFLSQNGKLLSEALINGRMISTFKLYLSFVTNRGKIDVVEIPEPKVGRTYPTGFEHVEFVTQVSFDEIERRYPTLKFQRSESNPFNPELSLKLTQGTVKFHPQSLERVIEIENALLK